MQGINRVTIVGCIGNDPEIRFTAGETAVTNISVATSRKWKDKNTGQEQSQTEWHRIIFFNKLAEIAGKFLKKGSKVYVEGYLRTNKYTDKEGIERYSTEIIADKMQMLDSKDSSSQSGSPVTHVGNEPDGFDDDIPF